jgi:hypothetical protein
MIVFYVLRASRTLFCAFVVLLMTRRLVELHHEYFI